MQQVISSGTAKAAASLGNDLAGKTGTTNDSKDAWFAGYSGNYVSVVWVGRDDNTTIGLTGGSGALPIWSDSMRRLKLEPVKMPLPKGVEWTWLDNGTGTLTRQSCDNAVYVPIISKYAPKALSDCVHYQNQLEQYGFDGQQSSPSDIGFEDDTQAPAADQGTPLNPIPSAPPPMNQEPEFY